MGLQGSEMRGARSFRVDDTHGIALQPGNEIRASSDRLSWIGLYASMQREVPYQSEFSAVADHLIVLHLDGPVEVERKLGRARSRRVIGPGGLFMLPGGMDFGVRLESPLESIHIYLRGELLQEVADEIELDGGRPAELVPKFGVRDTLIEQLALSLRGVLRRQEFHAHLYVDYVGRLLAAHLLREHSSAVPCGNNIDEGLPSARLQRALDFMEANLSISFRLGDLAHAAGVSPSHLSRSFKSATGLPPHQYLIKLRVERAQRLLLRGVPIVEVALACGFAHQEHLTRIFRGHTGYTPASYRRSFQS